MSKKLYIGKDLDGEVWMFSRKPKWMDNRNRWDSDAHCGGVAVEVTGLELERNERPFWDFLEPGELLTINLKPSVKVEKVEI